MKTTNILFTIALMFGLNAAAQTNNKVKNAVVSVSVGEFYSLNLSSDNATILLDSESKFLNGSASTPITMTVFSSRKYDVTAQVSSAQFGGTATNTSVNTNNIDLLVTKSSGNTDAFVASRTNNSLKFDQAEIIASSPLATKSDVFSLVYAIPAQNTSAFLEQYGKTITAEITYTLLPL